jgi:hypothetical protein
MPQIIPDSEWLAFLEKQYSDEHLFVATSQLGTVGFIRAVEKFVIERLGGKQQAQSSNPFLRLIELKRQEAAIDSQLEVAKAEAIAYYKAIASVLKDPNKLTGAFNRVGDFQLPAKLTWKLVKVSSDNPAYTEKANRLAEIETSLKSIHKEKLSAIETQIEALQSLAASILANEETKKLKNELKLIPAKLAEEPREELNVELPKG